MSEYEGYEALAKFYDRLNDEVDYEAFADYLERGFDRFLTKRPGLVLDLACGTGRITRALAAKGYDMIGVDGSDAMLSEAYAEGGEGILYLLQDMRELELYGTVGAVVCCLDSLNYLLCESDLSKVFALVHNYLDPDGLFLFDVNTPYKFERVYGDNAYILEDEAENGRGIYCGWQNEYDEETGICDFYLTLFEEQRNGTYERADEHQQEKCYDRQTVTRQLTENGFEVLGFFGDRDFSEPTDTTERWYVAARAKK